METSSKRKCWCGIDNGISGAVAFVFEDLSAVVMSTPTVTVGKETKIDSRKLTALLEEYQPHMTIAEVGPKQPAFGCNGNFSSGRFYGQTETVLELLNIRHDFPKSKVWQSVIFRCMPGVANGDTKGASIAFAKKTFPQVSLLPTPRSRKDDDNFADALCMAEYARRVSCGIA